MCGSPSPPPPPRSPKFIYYTLLPGVSCVLCTWSRALPSRIPHKRIYGCTHYCISGGFSVTLCTCVCHFDGYLSVRPHVEVSWEIVNSSVRPICIHFTFMCVLRVRSLCGVNILHMYTVSTTVAVAAHDSTRIAVRWCERVVHTRSQVFLCLQFYTRTATTPHTLGKSCIDFVVVVVQRRR